MRFKFVTFLVLLTLLSCKTKTKDIISGNWIVKQAYYHDEPVYWDLSDNGFDLISNNTCYLPVETWEETKTEKAKGVWDILVENDKEYLKISTTNRFFNKKFEIKSKKIVTVSNNQKVITEFVIVGDSLKMECVRLQ